jgi:predicted transcriptional regulator
MEWQEFFMIGFGVLLSILGFFLKVLHVDLKDNIKECQRNATRIEVMENKFSNIDEKMEDLKEAVKDLTREIKVLNTKMNK